MKRLTAVSCLLKRHALGPMLYAFSNPQSEIRNPHPTFRIPHSTFRTPQSEIRTPHSAISNLQSAISNLQSWPFLLAAALLILLGCTPPAPQHPSRIELRGSRNLRDLGSYSTINGRQIKKGMLYRSDHLEKVTLRDVEMVAALGVKTVYDLRSEEERENDPPRLPEIVSLKVVYLPVYYKKLDPRKVGRRILKGKVEEGDFQQLMIEAYQVYVLDFRPQWSELLQGLADSGVPPALIHCTYGRDRTGVAVAIVLSSLGVPRETVMEDYLLSNKFWESKTDLYSCLANCASFFRTPRSEVRALMEVRPEYLHAAFAVMDEHYGSFDGYLRDGLGIDDETLERLREGLLEKNPVASSQNRKRHTAQGSGRKGKI